LQIKYYRSPVLGLGGRECGAVCSFSEPDIGGKIARLAPLPKKRTVHRANQSTPTPALEVVLTDDDEFLELVIGVYS
jgi:hypothetical protein